MKYPNDEDENEYIRTVHQVHISNFKIIPVVNTFCRSFLLTVLTAAAFSCAGQYSPSGGPRDTTPPTVLETQPEPGTLGFQGNSFVLKFSEYVDRRSVADAIFLSPSLGRLNFEWSGTEVTVRFPDSLRPATTYILTLGSDVTDIRAGNRMAQSFALPFSTGDRIDSGSIAGRVYDDSPQGVMIFAYEIDHRNPDTLDARNTPPDFLTQTGNDGSFILPYLADGLYRLIAIRDEFKNLRYDPQTDRFGSPSADVRVSASKRHVKDVQFKLTVEDTTAPFLSSARSLDQLHLLLRFSEPIDTSILLRGTFTITDTTSNANLPFLDVSFADTSRTDIQLVTAPQDSHAVYKITVAELFDLSGNSIRFPGTVAEVLHRGGPDTTKPVITLHPGSDSTRNVPLDEPVAITLSEAVRKPTFNAGFSIRDSAGTLSNGLPEWHGSTRMTFFPPGGWDPGMWYTIKLVLDSVADFSDNRSRDSLLVRHFRAIELKTVSSIGGSVADPDSAGRGMVYIEVVNLANREQTRVLTRISGPGAFVLKNLREGRYVLSAFRDANDDGSFSFGNIFPFRFAERFTHYSDTLKVRARWPVEGASLRFR